jgi:hypothetical protein
MPVLSDKQNISSKESAYQNIYFTLRSCFLQNKYVPHTTNSRPPRGPAVPPGGQLHTLSSQTYTDAGTQPFGCQDMICLMYAGLAVRLLKRYSKSLLQKSNQRLGFNAMFLYDSCNEKEVNLHVMIFP